MSGESSPGDGTPVGTQQGERSTLVVLGHRRGASARTAAAAALAREGIHVAVREGNIRLSPHFFHTAGHSDHALEVLNSSHG